MVSGYERLGSVPKNSRNIKLEEVKNSTNYLALQDETGDYVINGDFYIRFGGVFPAFGTGEFIL